jgi:hypothetical protein
LGSIEREKVLTQVKELVLQALEGVPASVYLFGSWARGEERRTSDIDIAVRPEGPLPAGILRSLRDLLEEAPIPYRVDVVDLREADGALWERIKKEGILWKGCGKD